MSDQDIVAEVPRNIAGMTSRLPHRIRQRAAMILLPHLRAERDRLLQERILAQDLAPPVRIREREEGYEIG